ncbi:hypothetical protein LWP59_37045 [Amycolatopsis acidiphila]|uniref:Uncharacterized protein n=1 Tax=Amycolatopsis acidiphila TaxID=715473 RepID=A0A558AEI6_9PSEU|nr:hypothetical protein [Amycolatopsis acidiphila]TVT22665.1 hypothetical protein FNH06_12575 [Amycolatopsis acidiphila]UIJ59572.1 hypothetical protein LWP59_37045 [Amycolatopsis acidiphila]
MHEQTERFREITTFGVIPSPSGAGTLVLQGEGYPDCLLVMEVFSETDRSNEIAIVTVKGCQQAIFGYPNDEAYARDPRGRAGDEPSYGFFEVLSSTWAQRLAEYNRHAFPSTSVEPWRALRHFFIGCHDDSGEFLGESLHIELPGTDFQTTAQHAFERFFQPN